MTHYLANQSISHIQTLATVPVLHHQISHLGEEGHVRQVDPDLSLCHVAESS